MIEQSKFNEIVGTAENRIRPNGDRITILPTNDYTLLVSAVEELLVIKNPKPHQYELPDMAADMPCAICGRPVRDEIHP